MMIIGIDPGISGSICFFQDGIIKDVIEMPTMTDGKKNKRPVSYTHLPSPRDLSTSRMPSSA